MSGVNQTLMRAQARVGKPDLQRSRRSGVAATLRNVSTASTEMTPDTRRSRRSAARSRASDRPFARSCAIPPVKLGPQTMIRQQTGERINGRPDEDEQRRIAETVGTRLRELRGQYKVSMRDLERRSGVSRSSISLLEAGKRRPRESLLGWLAWGLAGPDKAQAVKEELVTVAGDLVVAESRWSERSHGRRAWRQLLAGGMEVPGWLIAPYCADVLGQVMPDRRADLVKVQELARSGRMPWPENAAGNMEAFQLATELDRATLYELRTIGRGMATADKANAARARRRRKRELRASLGLTGTDTRRPPRIPHGLPPDERAMLLQLAALDREASIAARLR